jgi:tyrosyl-tRNA synthetase
VKSVDEQLALIRRGVEAIVPEDELRQKLENSVKTGTPLRVKYGIDPTGIDVHLGHTVPLRKLRLFQELGHQAVLIIGNYTALVGDPSGRDEHRARLTEQQVEANAKDYLEQVKKVIHGDRLEVRYNGEWFSRFSFLRVMELLSRITVQRMLERDDFTKRLKEGTPIYLHECLYPMMQGHDSVEIRADVELGGSEQLFNLMRGRDLQVDARQAPQVCITLPILRGLDGVRRMGKSLANYIGIGESAKEMVFKVMKLPDHLMTEWFQLLTDRTPAEIARLTDPQATHPREAKMQLGVEIASFYHGREEAEKARDRWRAEVSEGGDPDNIAEVIIPAAELTDGAMPIAKLIVRAKLAPSNNEARRLVQGGGVNVGPDRTKITDPAASVRLEDGLILRVGKARIVRLRLG